MSTARVQRPRIAPDFETWKPISTTDRGDNNTFRFILGNDIAVKAARSGSITPWPDGARFAKIAWQQQLGADGLVHPGKFIQVELMVKDASRYKSTEGSPPPDSPRTEGSPATSLPKTWPPLPAPRRVQPSSSGSTPHLCPDLRHVSFAFKKAQLISDQLNKTSSGATALSQTSPAALQSAEQYRAMR